METDLTHVQDEMFFNYTNCFRRFENVGSQTRWPHLWPSCIC